MATIGEPFRAQRSTRARGRSPWTVGFVFVACLMLPAGCATRSAAQDADGGLDAGEASDASSAPEFVDGRCTATSCGPGRVCIHGWETHDPPGPGPDGSACSYGASRYGRCWNRIDECVTPPTACDPATLCGCVADASFLCQGSCQFPSLCQPCEVETDQTVDCYGIGI